jgi:hypothetical protein
MAFESADTVKKVLDARVSNMLVFFYTYVCMASLHLLEFRGILFPT